MRHVILFRLISLRQARDKHRETAEKNIVSAGIKAYLLNQTTFENGTFGKKCAYGHPGSQDDAAMAKSGSAFIKATMGW